MSWFGRFPVVADTAEKILFAAVFSYFAVAFALSLLRDPNVFTALYLADQTVIILFLLFRRPARRISEQPLDYGIAFAGTLLPLLAVPSSGHNVLPLWFCAVLMLTGMWLHFSAKLCLRRSFGIVAADRGIKVEGPYRLVRHPMYLGYMLVHLALVLAGPVLWNIVVFAVVWCTFALRIAAEERILSSNDDYRTFMGNTRFRLIPGLY